MSENQKKVAVVGTAVAAVALVLSVSRGCAAGSNTPSPAESAEAKRLHDEAMGTGTPTPFVPDDMPVAYRLSGDGSRWLEYTAAQEKRIASTREQCEVLLQRLRKLPNTRLPYEGKTFQALCDSMPSVPGSAKPEDGWGV